MWKGEAERYRPQRLPSYRRNPASLLQHMPLRLGDVLVGHLQVIAGAGHGRGCATALYWPEPTCRYQSPLHWK